MRVWTVHPLLVWERLQAAGTLLVDPAFYAYEDAYIPWQYEWMARQLQERIPDYQGHLPWWAYCEKPDLRWVRHVERNGTAHVRIELEVANALTFPNWSWNVVHSGHYLAATKREQEAWNTSLRDAVPDEDLWPLPEPWRREMEASWLRVFDSDLPADGWADMDEKYADKQAVFETLDLREVRAVTHFVGSRRW